MADLFRDGFGGSGTLATHNPDGIGSAYARDPFSAGPGTPSTFTLNGSGQLEQQPGVNYAQSTFTRAAGDHTLAVTFQVASTPNDPSQIDAYTESTSPSAYLTEIYISYSGGVWAIELWLYDASESTLYDSGPLTFVPSGGFQIASAEVGAHSVALKLDGATLATGTFGYTDAAVLPDAIGFNTSSNGHGTSSNVLIDEMSIVDGISPAPGPSGNELIKDFAPPVPGVPGNPGHPAYCIITSRIAWTTYWLAYVHHWISRLPTPPAGTPLADLILGTGHSWWDTHGAYFTVISQICYPAVPPVEGVPAQPADYFLGWNAGARSVLTLVGGGYYQFSMPTGVIGAVTGLTDSDSGTTYTTIKYGIYFSDTQFRVIESGKFKTRPAEYAYGDVFKVLRSGGVVTYHQNASLLYTSLRGSIGTLFADASEYAGLDHIDNASMVVVPDTVADHIGSSTGGGSLGGLYAFGSDHAMSSTPGSSIDSIISSSMGGLVVAGGGRIFDADLGGLSVFSLDARAVSLRSSLGGLTVSGDAGLLVPDFTFVHASLGGVYVQMTDRPFTTDRIDGMLGGLDVFGADSHDIYKLKSSLDGIYAFGMGGVGGRDAFIFMSMPYPNLFILSDSTGIAQGVNLSMPLPDLSVAEGSSVALTYSGPQFSVVAVTGELSHIFIDLPLNLSVTGTSTQLARANVVIDGPWGLSVASDSSVELDLPTPELAVVSGDEIAVNAPLPTLVVSGKASQLGFVSVVLRTHWNLFVRSNDSVDVEIPILEVSVRSADEISLSVPLPTVAVTASSATVGRISVPLPLPTISAWSDGEATLAVPLPAINIVAMLGRAIHVAVKALLPTITVSALTGPVGRVGLTVPLFIIDFGSICMIEMPLTMEVRGDLIITLVYEGFSITLAQGEQGSETYTTRLATFPFEHIVRWKDKYYGFTKTGMYELTGDDFDGAPIVSTIRTHPGDMGVPNIKRARSLLLSGKIGNDMEGTIIAGEEVEAAVPHEPAYSVDSRTQRIDMPRGVESVYLAYEITNRDGEFFKIDVATPENDILGRVLGGSK